MRASRHGATSLRRRFAKYTLLFFLLLLRLLSLDFVGTNIASRRESATIPSESKSGSRVINGLLLQRLQNLVECDYYDRESKLYDVFSKTRQTRVMGKRAYDILTSWPALPSGIPYVEGCVLIPTGRYTISSAQRNRFILVFNWDPVDGAKGLTFSEEQVSERRVLQLIKEIENSVQSHLRQSENQSSVISQIVQFDQSSLVKVFSKPLSSKSRDVILRGTQLRISVGSPNFRIRYVPDHLAQWFLVFPYYRISRTLLSKLHSFLDLSFEWKVVNSYLVFATARDPAALLALYDVVRLIFNLRKASSFDRQVEAKNRWSSFTKLTTSTRLEEEEERKEIGCGKRLHFQRNDKNRIPPYLSLSLSNSSFSARLIKGFTMWGQGQLEEEVQRDLFFPCDDITLQVLQSDDPVRLFASPSQSLSLAECKKHWNFDSS